MKVSSPSLEYLYLGDDSPYALSGNTQSLLEAGRSLGSPKKPRYAICKENRLTHYIARAASVFPVPKR